MCLKNFKISNVTFSHVRRLLTHCTWKFSGKQDHYDLGLASVKIFCIYKNVSGISPGNWLGWIRRHPGWFSSCALDVPLVGVRTYKRGTVNRGTINGVSLNRGHIIAYTKTWLKCFTHRGPSYVQ